RNVRVGRAHLRVNGKALIVGEPEGMVKVVADADNDDLLGLHLIGAGVTELVAEGALARFLEASLWELATSVYPHPTLSEAVGAAYALKRGTDWLFPYYRDLGMCLAMGMTPLELFLNFFAKATDPNSHGRQMAAHWSQKDLRIVSGSSPVTTQLLHATGCALA